MLNKITLGDFFPFASAVSIATKTAACRTLRYSVLRYFIILNCN